MGSNALNSDGDLLLINDGNDLGVMKADNAKSIKNVDLSLYGITLPDSKLPEEISQTLEVKATR